MTNSLNVVAIKVFSNERYFATKMLLAFAFYFQLKISMHWPNCKTEILAPR